MGKSDLQKVFLNSSNELKFPAFRFEDKIFKFYRSFSEAKLNYTKYKQVYDAGINSPEVYGLARDDGNSYFVKYGFLMQDLGDRTYKKINVDKVMSSAREAEIEKALKKGFVPIDSLNNDGNAIWFEDKCFLIDFDLWETPTFLEKFIYF